MILYHGTASANWPSIKAQGLRPRGGTGALAWLKSKHSVAWVEGFVPGRYIHPLALSRQEEFAAHRDPSVYLTSDRTIAAWFAAKAAEVTSSSPLILDVKVSARALRKDPAYSTGDFPPDGYKVRKPIPPSAIVHCETLPR